LGILETNALLGTSFGSQGSADRQFNRPEGVGVDPYSDTGLIYAADTSNTRIQVFKLEQ